MSNLTISVLDHGFVTLRNLAGPTRRPDEQFDADDIDPANSARMSFEQMDTGRSRDDDLKLDRYLMANLHTTPIEMIECWFEMKMPIFTARQFVRHRTVTINEVSARYKQLPAEWYIPAVEDIVIQSKDKKQGGRPVDLSNPDEVAAAQRFRHRLNWNCQICYSSYERSIADGIAMEQARLDLHVNHYTHWLWKQDLHNLMHFMSLRDHPHAQREAANYSRAVDQLVRGFLPHLMSLYDEFRRRP